MNKPDFSSMTKRELKDYALKNRDDDEVFRELIKRVEENPNTRTFSSNLIPEEEKEVIEMFRRSGSRKKEE